MDILINFTHSFPALHYFVDSMGILITFFYFYYPHGEESLLEVKRKWATPFPTEAEMGSFPN